MKEATLEPQPEIVSALRDSARKGATVGELVAVVQSRLGFKHDATIMVLWYFKRAFSLSLLDVLPVRNWLAGVMNDVEIDALILPRIESSKGQWQPSSNGTEQNGATNTAEERPTKEFAHDLH